MRDTSPAPGRPARTASARSRPNPRPKNYTYVPFRPGPELEARLLRVAGRLGTTVSAVVRTCCDEALPTLEAAK